MRPCALAVAVLLLATPALAQSEPETSGRERLAVAESAFAEGDFEKTLSELDVAATQATDDATLSAIHLLRGRCHAGVGDDERAREAFTAALEYDPAARLDPARVRPTVVELLNELRGKLQSDLNVRSNLTGALVLLDGKTVGVTPLRTTAAIGKHELLVRSADGMRWSKKQVLIRARRASDLFVELEEKAAVPDDPGVSSPAGEDDYDDLRPRVDTASMREAAGADEDGMRRTRFMVDLRGGVGNPFPQKAVPEKQAEVVPGEMNPGGELGLGFGGRELYASLHGTYNDGDFGMTARVGARVSRLVWLFGLQGSLDLPALFLERGFGMGAGASAGLNFAPVDMLEFHVEGGYRYFFQLPALQVGDAPYGAQHWLVTGGLRLWL